jgi:hypothetical protein
MAVTMTISTILMGTAALTVLTSSVAGATVIWGIANQVPVPGYGGGAFTSVSCTGVGDCTAVGADWSSGQPLSATESGGTWSSTTAVPGSEGGAQFNAVSCTGVGDCTAVGTDGNYQSIYATESGGAWGTPTEVPGSGGTGLSFENTFTGVSCTGVGDCTAVGWGLHGSDLYNQPLYATESGGTWSSTSAISTPSGLGQFFGVSCTGVGDCTAVGWSNGPIYAAESGGTWGSTTEVSGSVGQTVFQSVSCTGVGDCTAVGDDGRGPMSATETGAPGVVPPRSPCPEAGAPSSA